VDLYNLRQRFVSMILELLSSLNTSLMFWFS